jgi:2-polyprenyl-3-methyl-5-hydroxy-6-metoxy-1,4-benzoquinol methylase
MWFSESFQQRLQRPELMDQPALDESRHVQALHGLQRINYLSRCVGTFWPALREAAREVSQATPGQPLRVLDVATGGGDVPLGLWHCARRARLNVEIEGCDRSPVAVKHAWSQARAQFAPVRFFQADILREPIAEQYDVVMCSLFLHHLGADEAVQVLGTMAQVARYQVLVSDLRRSRLGWWLAWVGTRMLSMSPVVHFDGPVSVAAAFTCPELKNLADRAGLQDACLVRCWPSRMFLTWRKPT